MLTDIQKIKEVLDKAINGTPAEKFDCGGDLYRYHRYYLLHQQSIIEQQTKELKRLQGIEQALIDFYADMLPTTHKLYTAQEVYDWLFSTTGYKGDKNDLRDIST